MKATDRFGSVSDASCTVIISEVQATYFLPSRMSAIAWRIALGANGGGAIVHDAVAFVPPESDGHREAPIAVLRILRCVPDGSTIEFHIRAGEGRVKLHWIGASGDLSFVLSNKEPFAYAEWRRVAETIRDRRLTVIAFSDIAEETSEQLRDAASRAAEKLTHDHGVNGAWFRSERQRWKRQSAKLAIAREKKRRELEAAAKLAEFDRCQRQARIHYLAELAFQSRLRNASGSASK